MIITVLPSSVSRRLIAIAIIGALLPVATIGQQIYASTGPADDLQSRLTQAQNLAWSKHFVEAEREYRSILASHPDSRDAHLGLARVVLWQGRYDEARREFLTRPSDLDFAEGAATAAYWAGDYRTAEREFASVLLRDPKRMTSQQSLAEIESAARSIDRIGADGVDDDQPYRTLRAFASSSLFSDPLTRWDVEAGSWWMNASRPGVKANAPFVRIGNETTFPSVRLVASGSIGMLRYPDGTTRPIGTAGLAYRMTSHSAIQASFDQSEMLATATAIDRHIYAQTAALQWKRDRENSWLAAIDARRIRYSDHNDGWAASAYALAPVAKLKAVTFSAGASSTFRDTSESRFYVESVSSNVAGGAFVYSYRGAYTPYWTPREFREARAIVAFDSTIWSSKIRLQADGGVTRDLGTGFGPESGTTLFPRNIFQFEYTRTYHPYHLQLAFSRPLSSGLSIEAALERSSTVFYKANGIRASLVRRR